VPGSPTRTTATTGTEPVAAQSPEASPGIAIVAHDSAAELRRNLSGHAALAEALGAPLVVVDNASRDETVAVARELGGPNLTLIAAPRNRGYAAGVNAAAATMPGRDILLLNPDVEALTPEAVGALREFLAAHPRAGVVAPRLLGRDGAPQVSARRFPTMAAMLGSTAGLGRIAPLRRSYERYLEPSSSPSARIVDWVIGAAMLLRRAAFDEVGGWDDRFFLYMEDADYCRRLARAGWEVWIEPAVTAVHGYARASSAPSASVISSWARRQHVASLARFFSREPRMLWGGGRR
jgi:GT2 family glycosyltransferase